MVTVIYCVLSLTDLQNFSFDIYEYICMKIYIHGDIQIYPLHVPSIYAKVKVLKLGISEDSDI